MVQPTTIPSRALDVWRRLYTRFALEPYPASVGPDVLKTIVPVTDADVLLRTPAGQQADGDLTGSAGTYVAYFTVPTGRRWTLKMFLRVATTAASLVVVSVGGVAIGVSLSSTSTEVQHGISLTLDQGDSIGMLASGNAGDSSRSLEILYDEEDAF